jgi:hypothetical protein
MAKSVRHWTAEQADLNPVVAQLCLLRKRGFSCNPASGGPRCARIVVLRKASEKTPRGDTPRSLYEISQKANKSFRYCLPTIIAEKYSFIPFDASLKTSMA